MAFLAYLTQFLIRVLARFSTIFIIFLTVSLLFLLYLPFLNLN